jgi:urease subunit gamma/beta
MELTPSEQDRVLLLTAAIISAQRLASGLLLNKPEAVSLMCAAVIECARAGGSHADAVAAGTSAVTAEMLLPGVASMLRGVSVEAVFDDGLRLVALPDFANEEFVPGQVVRRHSVKTVTPTSTIPVTNTASIDISLTSHIHVFETNPMLLMDRSAAYGMRPAIASAHHILIPAGQTVEVPLVEIAGERVIIGFAGMVDGPLDAPTAKIDALKKLRACGYLDSGVTNV